MISRALSDLKKYHLYVLNHPTYHLDSKITISGWSSLQTFSMETYGARILQKSLNKNRPALVDIFKDESVANGGFGLKLEIDKVSTLEGFEKYIIFRPLLEDNSEKIPKEIANTWCIPKNPELFQLPDDNNTIRVTGKTNKNYLLSGSTHFYRMLSALRYFSDISVDKFENIIDWGCGSGRLTMHIANYFKNSNVTGVDVDPINLNWCDKNLPGINTLQIPWNTPTPLQSNKYDLLFAFSVFSHISFKKMHSWLAEIYRIMKSDSYLIITTLGPVSTASRKANESFFQKLYTKGYVEWDNKGQIDDQRPSETDYLNIAMTYNFAQNQFSTFFEVLGVIKGLGPQDGWVLYKS